MIEPYSHVGDPDWLRAHNLFVAEGRFVVSRLIASRRFAIQSFLLTPAAQAALADTLPADVPIHVVEPDAMRRVTGFNFHRGCLALAERPAPLPPEALHAANRLVALEGIGNPDNIGGIFRVCAAFGVDGVLLDPTCGDPLYRKAVRTSMGAALQVPFARVPDLPAGLEDLKAQGFRALALTPRADAIALRDVELTAGSRVVVMAGAEGSGLSERALAAADQSVRIPTTTDVDSLNVTVALGIALANLP